MSSDQRSARLTSTGLPARQVSRLSCSDVAIASEQTFSCGQDGASAAAAGEIDARPSETIAEQARCRRLATINLDRPGPALEHGRLRINDFMTHGGKLRIDGRVVRDIVSLRGEEAGGVGGAVGLLQARPEDPRHRGVAAARPGRLSAGEVGEQVRDGRVGLVILPILVAALALGGCAPSVSAVNPAPPGISYRLDGDSMDRLKQRARDYCGQWGKQASLDGVSGDGDKIAKFDCG
jgi:hypothetical protein